MSTILPTVDLNIRVSGQGGEADRILLYGTGGIGKTTAATFLPDPLFLDIDRGTRKIQGVAFDTVEHWAELRGKVTSIAKNPPRGIRSLVLDTVSVAEGLATEYVVETRRTEKGKAVDSVEGFGWGKGWQYTYDEFGGLLADLDRVNDRGIIICLVAHVVTSTFPNPMGEDFIRWEPALYGGDKKGRGSIRDKLKTWSEHTVFIGYDVHVEDGKGIGTGTRTAYTAEMPTHIAKSRSNPGSFPFTLQDPGAIWRELGIV